MQSLRQSAAGLQIKGLIDAFRIIDESEHKHDFAAQNCMDVLEEPARVTTTRKKRSRSNTADDLNVRPEIMHVELSPLVCMESLEQRMVFGEPESVNEADMLVATENGHGNVRNVNNSGVSNLSRSVYCI